MKILPTTLAEILVLEPTTFADARGYFMETFNAAAFEKLGLPTSYVQDNHSRSSRGVIRGLHYQVSDPQGKLVRCVRGAIFDVAVDIRRGSPTYGKWTGVELTSENNLTLWIPPRFAHGFSVLSDEADVIYKCTTLWSPATDRCIVWNDPDLAIDWRVTSPLVSPKDAAGKRLHDAEVFEYDAPPSGDCISPPGG